MLAAYCDFWKRALDFTGRSERAAYWWPWVLHGLVWVGLFLHILFRLLSAMGPDGSSASLDRAIWLLVLYDWLLFIPNLSLFTRRLRDTDFSLIFLMLPISLRLVSLHFPFTVLFRSQILVMLLLQAFIWIFALCPSKQTS